MIFVKNMNNGTIHKVVPTIFPDGTSQVWKLDFLDGLRYVKIIWHFEEERELVQINQLLYLLTHHTIKILELYVPYLPYGRQDKDISNEATFALTCFLNGLPKDLLVLTTLDAHSKASAHVFESLPAKPYIQEAIKLSGANVLVFPDEGARRRYDIAGITSDGFVVLEKIRDQKTGQILSQKISFKSLSCQGLAGKNLLIIDDICDGGWTFTNAAKILKDADPAIACIDLYVTHGIFSKGRQVLHDAGIRNIYTTKSLIKNTDGFDLEEI